MYGPTAAKGKLTVPDGLITLTFCECLIFHISSHITEDALGSGVYIVVGSRHLTRNK